MHSWDIMPPASYEHNWCTTTPTHQLQPQQIKSEPQDLVSYPNEHPAGHPNVRTDRSSSPPISHIDQMTHHQNFYSNSEGGGDHIDGITNIVQNVYRPLGFNPLTPPGYPNAIIPHAIGEQSMTQPTTPNRLSFQNGGSSKMEAITQYHSQSQLTPSHTPPMDVTPPKSPKYCDVTPDKESSLIDDNQSMSGDDCRSMMDTEDDEDDIRMPKVNSHGKVKTFKCKQCEFIGMTKMIFWEHTKEHIKPEKMLKCPKCPFVTEYKHHLEYHLRNHDGSKPFQCNKCSYSCVNKSMLNSHLKSHSNIYQYRCSDCSYATKYCHSLKLHLRKYVHKPAMVLNQDGTPNPLPIIDVYGTRRGPKTRSSRKEDGGDSTTSKLTTKNISTDRVTGKQHLTNIMPSLLPNPFANMLQNSGSGTNMNHLFPYLNLNFQMFAAQQQALAAQLSPNVGETDQRPDDERSNNRLTESADEEELEDDESDDTNNNHSTDSSVIHRNPHNHYGTPSTSIPTCNSGSALKNRRKGRAFKLDMMSVNGEHKTEQKENGGNEGDGSSFVPKHPTDVVSSTNQSFAPSSTTQPACITTEQNNERFRLVDQSSQTIDLTDVGDDRGSRKKSFECKFCEITFKDAVLYTIHMGYHGYNDVFKCNMCGEKCDDRISFFLHIARNSHP